MQKRGLSGVVVTVLILLLVIVAVVIVWKFASPTIINSITRAQVETEFVGLNFEIRNLDITEVDGVKNGDVNFVLYRKAGGGRVDGFIVVLEDDGGNSATYNGDDETPLNELESVAVEISGHGLPGNIIKISVYAVIMTPEGPVTSRNPVASGGGGGGSENGDNDDGDGEEETTYYNGIANFEDSAILWLKMDAVDGLGNPIDSSQFPNTCTAQGDAVQTSGKFGGAFIFDGVGDYVDCGAGSSINYLANKDYTYSLWFNPSAGASQVRGVMSDSANTYTSPEGWYVWYDTSEDNIYLGIGSEYGEFLTAPIASGEWHHLAFTHDYIPGADIWANVDLYVDGVFVDSIGVEGVSSAGNLWVGNYLDDEGISKYFKGTIDEVIIFNRVLTLGEITQLYNGPS